MVPADSDRISRVPPYSGCLLGYINLPVRACHPLRERFPTHSCSLMYLLWKPLQPLQRRNAPGLGSSPFDRHYSGNRYFLSLPPGTEMFQFPGFAPPIGGARPSAVRVAPFGHRRINTCLQFPDAFRSLPRPSSPPEAKASTVRSCNLLLE